MERLWRIELFGGLRAERDRIITRFSGQKVAALLAYLSLYPRRLHRRDELAEILWPGEDPDAGRHRLRMALSRLRRQLEPPGIPAGAVLAADRSHILLASCATDVEEFEAALVEASRARSNTERIVHRRRAIALYRGELLHGSLEEWVVPERRRLEEACLDALAGLACDLERAGDLPGAIQCARRAVTIDPLREEAHAELIRLLREAGQPEAARRQQQELEWLLSQEEILEAAPGTDARSIFRAAVARLFCPEDPTRHTDPPRQQLGPHALPSVVLAPPHRAEGARTIATVTVLLIDLPFHSEDVAPKQLAATAGSLLRQLARDRGGSVIQTTEDRVFLTFRAAGDALACALAAQRSLAEKNWRMALHSADSTPEREFGHEQQLEHASRMIVAAHPGQILCSEAAAGLLRPVTAEPQEAGVALADLGLYRLPGATAPERLFQIDDPAIPRRVFPPLQAAWDLGSRLPLPLTRFFGREVEMTGLAHLLTGEESPPARLVTLTGTGGSGKTRLALEVAARLRNAFRGAVWFVSLADLSDATRIPAAVRDAMGLPLSPHLTPQEQVIDTLSTQPSLLVLDNYEHLIGEPADGESGALFVRTLIQQVPSLYCLVTSRRRLGLEGEREFDLLPLPTPPSAAPPEELVLWESVQLFIDRGQAARPDFQLTPANAPAVAAICARLEGIPLAIELAAARVSVMTPQQMLGHLEQRFDLLVSRRRDLAARHRTLWAAIDWSYQLLEPRLQRVFAGLSIFRGGWTLEAAEAVCSALRIEGENTALDDLEQLRECSLILADSPSTHSLTSIPEVRFRMLETLREFSARQLSPDEKRSLERRHAEYVLELAERVDVGIGTLEGRAHLERMERERENLSAAIEAALVAEPELALRLAGAIAQFYWMHGPYAEGRQFLERALNGTSVRGVPRARALKWFVQLSGSQEDRSRRRQLMEEALSIYREQNDQPGIASVLARMPSDTPEERRRNLEESLRIRRELGDLIGMAYTLNSLVFVGRADRDPEEQRRLFLESLALFRQAGDHTGMAHMLNNLGCLAAEHGDDDEARVRLEESLATLRAIGDAVTSRGPLIHLGLVHYRRGEYATARALLTESLRICRRLGDLRLIVECLHGLVEVAIAEARPGALGCRAAGIATRLLAASVALREAIDFAFKEWEPLADTLRETLGDDAFTAAWEAGRSLTWQQAADLSVAGHAHE